MIDWWLILLFSITILFFLMFLGIPVAFSLGFTSLLCILLFIGDKGLYLLPTTAVGRTLDYLFVAVPLFIFMAELVICSGISKDAFDTANKWLGWIPGGLAVASEVVAVATAAIIGTSTAGAAVVGGTAIPEMKRHGYNIRLAAGATAAGGALGILIPPSLMLIFFGILTGQPVSKLFIGGILPGLLLAGLFSGYIIIHCKINPTLAPRVRNVSWRERLSSLWKIWGVIFLIVFMLGSIYWGICTPIEVAGIGSSMALILTIVYRRLNLETLKIALLKTVKVTSMLIWIIISAFAFSYVLNYLEVSRDLVEFIVGVDVSRWLIIVLINITLLLLGCIMDPGAIILITIPIFYPIIQALDFDPIWFGVMFVVNLEMAEITPPFGLNLFVIKSVAPEVGMTDLIRGSLPFVALQALGLALIIIFPSIVTWLPETM